ncbi:MAG: hypothetical protein ACFFE8_03370 [Candidatus Heimdallarchaeota archaeon]
MLLESDYSFGIGHVISVFLFSVPFGFLTALIIGIAYYRFKWLDYGEEDRPDIGVSEPLANTQIGIHIIFEKLLPNGRFYLLGGFFSLLWLTILLSPMLSM